VDLSQDERSAWDRRYAQGEYTPRTSPSPFFVQWLPEVARTRPTGTARALDVATGAGRHALHLAEAGYAVDAVDISQVAVGLGEAAALKRGVRVNWLCTDLDEFQPEPGYHLITVFRYRNLALWPLLADALADGGWVLVEHHLRTTADVDGPPNDEFRVAPGELLRAFGSLRVMHYSEQIEVGDRPDTMHAVVRMAACRGGPGW
jgi:SAM-dependent methyltransferase